MKKQLFIICSVCITLSLMIVSTKAAELSKENEECLECHKELMLGIYNQWKSSKHGALGIGCFDCHGVDRTEPDAIAHEGAIVTTIITPEDCGKCHQKQMEEFLASNHATSRDIFDKKDDLSSDILKDEALTFTCKQCHGSAVKINEDGTPDPDTWPNSGIGRKNPDGSNGACSACHIGHLFTKATARRPEVCGRCHLGPDHPQLEIYEESKHGIRYKEFESATSKEGKWIPGIDYFNAPTCSSCHMGATRNQPVTHDIGSRLSRKLRVSIITKREDSEEKLENMKDVCRSCHSLRFTDNFFLQSDKLIELYNTKFAIPSKEIFELLTKEGVIKKDDIKDRLDWTYDELLYHKGRTAQHGAAMGGAGYAWRYGLYNVAKHFYTEFMPDVEKACKDAGRLDLYDKIFDKYFKNNVTIKSFTKDPDFENIDELINE